MSPSTFQSAGSGSDRRRFDDPERDRAARFLATDMPIDPHVRGMTDQDRVRAWLAAAAELDDRGAVTKLKRRLTELREGSA